MAAKEAKPTGLKPPSKIGRISGIAKPTSSTKSSSVASSRAHSPDGSKTGDDCIIGDRVYVGGTKPGVIAYLGETKFAAGDWAGIILDELEGKNDGTVQGVRYFQCEPKRGMFAKPAKLTRHKVHSADASPGAAPPASSAPVTSTPRLIRTESISGRPGLPRKNGSISASNTSLSCAALATVGAKHIKLGERVVVNGAKVGTLRFLGTTDFAQGEWAGVALSEAIGKNDGSVGGRRYFECQPLHGLFAPVHKVTKESVAQSMSPIMGGRATPSISQQRTSSHRLCSTPSMTSGLNSRTKDLSVSQESLNSIGSAVSTASRSRVAANRVAQARNAYKAVSTAAAGNTATLQKALKEKEEHIEQLIRERELERSEVFKASVQKEELEEELSKVKADFESVALDADFRVNELELKIEHMQDEKRDLESSLSEQKTKLEDLQFQMEEEAICRGDEESSNTQQSQMVEQLSKELEAEKQSKSLLTDQISKLQTDIDAKGADLDQSQSQVAAVQSQLAELMQSLSEAEARLVSQRMGNETATAKTDELTKTLLDTDSSLEAFRNKSSQLENELVQVQEELESTKVASAQRLKELDVNQADTAKLTAKNTELQTELDQLLDEKTTLGADLGDVKLQASDLQRSLETSEVSKANLVEEKTKLQQHIDDLMKNSGDSSQQLSMLSDELREKNRKLESLQESLSETSNKTERLQELLARANEDHKTELSSLISQHEKATTQNTAELADLRETMAAGAQEYTSQVEGLNKEISSKNAQLEQSSAESKHQLSEHSSLLAVNENKDGEIGQLRLKVEELENDLEEKGSSLGATSQQCDLLHKQITTLQDELEARKKETTQLQTMGSDSKSECSKLSNQLSEVRQELETALQLKAAANVELGDIKLKVSDLQRALETSESMKSNLVDEKNKLEAQVEDLMKNSGDSSHQLAALNGELKEKNHKLESLKQSLSESNNKTERLQELLDRANEDHKTELSSLTSKHEKATTQHTAELADLESRRLLLEQSHADQVETMTREIQTSKQLCEETRAQHESQLKECLRLNVDLGEVNAKLSSSSHQACELEKLISDKESTLEGLRESSSQLEREMKQLEENLNASRLSATHLETQLSSSQSSAHKLSDENSQLEGELQALEEGKTNLVKELKDIKLEAADVQRNLETAESAKSSLGSEKAKLELQIDSLVKNSGQSSQQLASLHEELREKDSKLETLQESLSETNNKTERLEELLDRANEDHKTELSSLTSQHEKATTQHTAELADVESKKSALEKDLCAEIEELKQQVAGGKNSLNELRLQSDTQLQEKDGLLAASTETNQELDTELTQLRNAHKELESKLLAAEQRAQALVTDSDTLKVQLADEKSSALSQHGEIVANLKIEIETNQKAVEHHKNLVEQHKQDFEKQIAEGQSQCGTLEEQLQSEKDKLLSVQLDLEGRLAAAKTSADESLFELEEQLIQARSDAETLKKAAEQKLGEMTALSTQVQEAQTELGQTKQSLSDAERRVKDLSQSMANADEDREKLQTQIFSLEESALNTTELLKSSRKEYESLNSKLKSLDKEMKKTSKKADLEKTTLSAELEGKQQELEIQTSLTDKYEAEVKHLQSQISSLSDGTEQIRTLRTRLSKAEDERDEFKRDVEDLTFKFDELSQMKAGEPGAEHIAESSENDRYQIDFLNSVIVDQQAKIEDLNKKIQVLAEVGDVGQNGYEFDYSAELSEETNMPPPRLFCDICDIFDAHDTDDCPIQAQDDDGPAPSHHHVERGNSRPYCDTCEVFGHATEDCEEQDEW